MQLLFSVLKPLATFKSEGLVYKCIICEEEASLIFRVNAQSGEKKNLNFFKWPAFQLVFCSQHGA